MDRFVWFVLLIVMSHLVTEFTRVTGYARGPRNDVIMVNDSSIQPKQVQNLVLYPGQDYGLYERPSHYSSSTNNNNNYNSNSNSNYNSNYNGNSNSNYNNNNYNNNNNNMHPNAPIMAAGGGGGAASAPNAAETSGGIFPTFSFRPLIDSIFEIPISTLRAVNNLVARLTGSFQQAPQSGAGAVSLGGGFRAATTNEERSTAPAQKPLKLVNSAMREERA